MDNNHPLLNNDEANKTEQLKTTEQITTEESQYRYLKELNKKLKLFKNQNELSGKKDEETETIRR